MTSPTPPPLEALPPGPGLCARLAPLRPADLPDESLLDVLTAAWRQLAFQQAQVWAVMAELASRAPGNLPGAEAWTPEQVFEAAVDEVRAELRLTRRAARRELERAEAVATLPAVAAALAGGVIDRARAIVLAEGCWDLTPEQASRLLAEVLPDAGRVTATGLADRVRRVAIALDPAWAERRYREAVRSRRVIGYLNEDGSATVSGQYLPADQAAAACARVNGLAAGAKRSGADAPTDHLRAELFLGLLDGRFTNLTEAEIVAQLVAQFPPPVEPTEKPTKPTEERSEAAATVSPTPVPSDAGVEVRVGLGTLLELDDQPGEIAGWGPVPAPVARDVAARQRRGEWRFAILDPAGRLLADGLTRHRPTGQSQGAGPRGGVVELQVPLALLTAPDLPAAHPEWARLISDLITQYAGHEPFEQDPQARFAGRPLRRHSQVQHRACLFPGCRRPARECDLDHREEYARGGLTVAQNLGPGCRHDHGLKTAGGWRLIKQTDTTYVWVSPLGRRHLTDIDPIAPPLPAPLPRTLGPERRPHEPAPDPPPTFAPPLAPATGPGPAARIPDPDPPPY